MVAMAQPERATTAPPRLSIGLPVFNGELYLEAAIQSVLDSTYQDWELIVSDNASTDRTVEIVEAAAIRDPRIRLDRNPINIGALANFNRVFALSRGEYFKWLAYDDICGPDLLTRCIDVLDRDESIVLCSGRFREIDQFGEEIREQPYALNLDSQSPHKRLRELMRTDRGHPILYGVIRAHALRQTGLMAPYHGSDRALLAQLTLLGRLWEIPELLWSSRDHPARSPYARGTVDGWDRPKGHRWPTHLTITANMGGILASARLSRAERVRSAIVLIECVIRRLPSLAPVLAYEVVDAIRTNFRRLMA